MKKTKTKIKSKTRIKKKTSIYTRSFHGSNSVKMLATALMVVIFLDGMIFGLIGAGDIKTGAKILDVSDALEQTVTDMGLVVQPLVDVAASVDKVYKMAAIQTIFLLDNNLIVNIGSLFADVNSLFDIASRGMVSVLDISDQIYPDMAYASY